MGTIKFAVAPSTGCLAKFPIPRLASRTTQKCQIWYQFSIIIPAQSYLIAEDIKILVFDFGRPQSVTAVCSSTRPYFISHNWLLWPARHWPVGRGAGLHNMITGGIPRAPAPPPAPPYFVRAELWEGEQEIIWPLCSNT